MRSGIAGRLKTAVSSDLSHLHQSASFEFYSCPEPIAIGTFPHGLDAQPVSLLCSLVAEQDRRTVENRDYYVLAAIIQEVGSSHAAPDVTTRQGDSRA